MGIIKVYGLRYVGYLAAILWVDLDMILFPLQQSSYINEHHSQT